MIVPTLTLDIPGFGRLRLKHLVLDYNGTLARDGIMLTGVPTRLKTLSKILRIHVVTADTFGKARSALAKIACELTVLPPANQDRGKLAYIESLGPQTCVAIGNGRNDRLMLSAAALAIGVIQDEGAAFEAVEAADVVARDILDALDLLIHPLRLTATLRS